MSISALSQSTVQALCSSQVLNDPVSLVKELVENSLDATARSITVEIASNALAIIQVKDNGYGVVQGDRTLLASRHCTSKIRNLDDLSKIGGRSLGFRGVALASAAEMSDSLTIHTKVEGELVGEALSFNRKGQLISRVHKSLPSGTTVRVEDFLKYVPVRRQTSLKSSLKILARIKLLLQSYALTRPAVHFSLNVLKDEDNPANWVYGPKKESGIIDVVSKISGIAVASNCVLKHWRPSQGFVDNEASLHGDGADYAITALLPTMRCDATSINHRGQFFSIDSRPVCSTRGTMKRINDCFKSYAQATAETNKLIDPFLCLNLVCPSGSYDANVEPAKDGMLFYEEDKVIEICKAFFTAVYGKPSASVDHQSNHEIGRTPASAVLLREQEVCDSDRSIRSERPPVVRKERSRSIAREFLFKGPTSADLDSLAKEPNASSSTEVTSVEHGMQLPNTLHRKNQRHLGQEEWQSSMYQSIEDLQTEYPYSDTEENLTEEDELDNGIKVSNPWTIAKMNAPARKKAAPGADLESADFNGQLLTPKRLGDAGSSPVRFDHRGRPALKPRHANQLPSPAKDVISQQRLDPSSSPLHSLSSQRSIERDGTSGLLSRSIGPLPLPSKDQEVFRPSQGTHVHGTLDTWMQKPMQKPVRHTTLAPSQQSDPGGTCLIDIPDVSQRPRKGTAHNSRQQGPGLHRPFVSPVRRQNLAERSQRTDDPVSPFAISRKPPLRGTTALETQPGDLQLDIESQTGQHPSAPQSSRPSTAAAPRNPQTNNGKPPRNIWLSQEHSLPNSTARLIPNPLASRLAPHSPSPAEPNRLRLPNIALAESIAAIAALHNKLAVHDAYIRRGDSARDSAFALSTLSAEVLAAWEAHTRHLIVTLSGSCGSGGSGRGGSRPVEPALDLKRALKEHARGLL